MEYSGAHWKPGSLIEHGKGVVGMLFLGTHTPKLDDKGRMFLPAKFRARLAEGLVITRGQEHCLYVYTVPEFERIATEMTSGTTTTSRDVRDYQRVFLSGASDEVPDKQGRITIPQVLRDYAGLSTECTVIGAGNRIEVWDTAAWTTYLEGAETAFAERSEEVVPGVI